MKNTKLRVAWVVPNVFCYLMFIGSLIFVSVNAEGIKETGRMSMWILLLLALFLVSIFGSVRFWYWIKKAKL